MTIGVRARSSGCRQDFDPVDLGVFLLGGEGNIQLAVGDFHVDGFDVGAIGTAGLGPDIKILEFLAFDVERKYTLARPGDAIKSFGKMKLYDVFAVGTG